VVIKSIKLVAELPVIGVVDKLLGAVLGVLVAIIIFHVVVAAAELGYLGNVGATICREVSESELLTGLRKLDVIELVLNWKDQIVNNVSENI
jgi:ABC-type lipoprotein release transport system permease subunit